MGMVMDKPRSNDLANLQNALRPPRPGPEGIWEYDKWLTENQKGHFD